MPGDPRLIIEREECQGVHFHVLKVEDTLNLINCHISGIENYHGGREVVNSIVEGKKAEFQRQWKLKIASTVRNELSLKTSPVPSVMSIAFFMSPANHGGRRYDVENFMKPVVDGVAMGMWGDLETVQADPKARFDADDSVFKSFYIEHCQIEDPGKEGIHVVAYPLSRP